jgi:CO/xanthine dehydrogenase Mo-binding subunit
MPSPAVDDVLARPGGAGRTSDAADVQRAVGFAVGFKNLMFAEGYDDYSTARCSLTDGVATVTCAAAEVGQGFVTLVQQFARTILGVDEVVVAPADTSIGSAGSTSASRQTMMSGGAVEQACRAVRAQLLARVGHEQFQSAVELDIVDGRVVSRDGAVDLSVIDLFPGETFEATEELHHTLTHPLDVDGQGDAHVSFACSAHRAVVDVDPQLGLVRVVHLATAQDVGKVLNPLQVVGQIEGGSAQGVGLALMEELVVDHGVVRNPSFTDYLIPTALDLPDVTMVFVEQPEPGAPFGAKGVGEPPTVSSTPAVVAAIRAATGRPLTRVPVRPVDVTGT